MQSNTIASQTTALIARESFRFHKSSFYYRTVACDLLTNYTFFSGHSVYKIYSLPSGTTHTQSNYSLGRSDDTFVGENTDHYMN